MNTAPKTGAERVADHNARLRDQWLKQIRSIRMVKAIEKKRP